jgi:hypothetical protein
VLATRLMRCLLCALLGASLLLAAPPAPAQQAAQQNDASGELQILTSHDTEKDSGVWIDGEYVGYLRDFWGNKKILLPAGEHEVSVRKFGYKDFTQKIKAETAQALLLPIMLELDVSTQYPTENTATLKITANPPEAAVLIDGAYVGYASQVSGLFKSLTVTAGRRRVRVEMQGYRTFETEVELPAGRAYEIRTALEKGGAELDGAPRIVQTDIRDGATSLQLKPGRTYLYGMAIGGKGSSTLFSLGQYASVFHEGGFAAAAVAYGSNAQNTYNTQTDRHILGGASIGGAWQTFRAFYGSNGSTGASSVLVNFTVEQDSLVVVLALASSQQRIELEGLPGLQVDALHSGATAGASMVIAHNELPPGMYTVVERSAALTKDADRDTMADLIAVFVFGHKEKE